MILCFVNDTEKIRTFSVRASWFVYLNDSYVWKYFMDFCLLPFRSSTGIKLKSFKSASPHTFPVTRSRFIGIDFDMFLRGQPQLILFLITGKEDFRYNIYIRYERQLALFLFSFIYCFLTFFHPKLKRINTIHVLGSAKPLLGKKKKKEKRTVFFFFFNKL